MIAISLGWGVQSFTLAAMAALGELPRVDAAIHSDTQHERSATYAFAAQWTPWLAAHGVKVATVTNRLRGGTAVVIGGNKTPIPARTINDGSEGRMKRQCTGDWKIQPIRRYLQEHRNGRAAELWLGISTDEFQRAKDADVAYITHRFPLLDLGMSRADCLMWLEAHGLPSPGKSSCVFCPFLNKRAWQEMKRAGGADWQHAVEVDNAIRNVRLPGQLFVHPRLLPLPQAVVIPEDSGYSQLDMLSSDDGDAECDSGHCFL
jgi:hypothetical protein